MSRQPQNAAMEPDQVEMEDEEVDSQTGEGADEVMEEAEEGYTSSTPTSTLTWIAWFCSLPGHEYFCEVSEDFIEDDFNLTGLSPYVPFWKEALEMVLDVDPEEDASKIPDVSIVEQSAEILYGLVHSRYILTRAGLQAMVDKYENGVFGSCPRVLCTGTNVVPCGRTDLPSLENVKLFCPNCNDIYTPPSSRFQSIDAAYFGTTFPHLFFQGYRELAAAPFYRPSHSSAHSSVSPRSNSSGSAAVSAPFVNPNPYGGQKRAAGQVYQPRIYGFKVNERAKSGPRMQWLRKRPETAEELDLVDWRGRWIDEGDDYEEEDGEGEVDRQMEDFDPDAVDDEDDEEEEEQDDDDAPNAAPQGHRRAAPQPPPTPSTRTTSARTSPTSSAAPRTPTFSSTPPAAPRIATPSPSYTAGKVKAVRQWAHASATEAWVRTAHV
ncbi:hypothetical protein PLICRDRAFT_33963 [Plicaturopsis crispa FD-325 SS-3]|nr:hypothetical protein PLICRDRAFT_33963 [Plicaturopsis crispa FD-325 SS-3]